MLRKFRTNLFRIMLETFNTYMLLSNVKVANFIGVQANVVTRQ